MVEHLIASGGAAAKAGHKLQVVLAGTEQDVSKETIMALEDLHDGPGGRHSNDHSDYRWNGGLGFSP